MVICNSAKAQKESTHDEVVASRASFIGREVTCMTVYEIIMIILRVIEISISLGMLLIALLTYFRKGKGKHK